MIDSLISVVIPVHNSEEYVNRCIDSILKQTYKKLEVIIVNDGSDGNIKEIAEEYMRLDNRVKYYEHQCSKGSFQARCTGMQYAAGDYFAFVDSDDWICEDYYRILLDKAIQEDADIVTADFVEIHREGLYAPHNMLSQGQLTLTGEKAFDMLFRVQGLDYGWWVIWNKLYARHIWDDSRSCFLNMKEHLVMCDDVLFSIAFFANAKHLCTTHNNYYYYRKEGNTATINSGYENTKKSIGDIDRAFGYAEEVLKKSGSFSKYRTNLQNWKNNILRNWDSRIDSNAELTEDNKTELRTLVKGMITEEDDNTINRNKGVCSSSFSLLPKGDAYAEIKKAIIDPDVKIISFDVFDTLLVRPFFEPTDLFELMDYQINKSIQTVDWFDFRSIRCEAEKKAREVKKIQHANWDDITLDDIYDQIVILCPQLAGHREQIKQLEYQTELKYNQRRESGYELYQLARYCKKRVICVSDMYLNSEEILTILREKGYTEIDKVYVSCETGKAKANRGALFQKVVDMEGVTGGNEILHVGDNPVSDVNNAKNAGLQAACLPRTIDVLKEQDGKSNGGRFLADYCLINDGYRDTQQAFTMLGLRCMIALAANRIYDNPFVLWKKGSDLNNDAYTIGHFCLGPALFGTVSWLIHNIEEGGFEHLHFMARDGYLPMKVYEELNKIYQLPVNLHYTYLTRKAITPLLVRKPADFYNLANNMTFTNMTPESVLKLLQPLIPEEKYLQREQICKKNGIRTEQKFTSLEDFCGFGRIFFSSFFEERKADEYKEGMRVFLDPMFKGKTATFDVGYSGRIESALARNYGYNITAHYIHTSSSIPYYRESLAGIIIKTLFPFRPFVTGVIREIMISELGPSCIGYVKNGGVYTPLMGSFSANIQTEFVISMLQESALDFVKSMVRIFGEDLKLLKYRYFDACMPLEHYMLRARHADMELWGGFEFEDDMGMGDHISVYDWWTQTIALHEWQPGTSTNVFKSEEYLNSLTPFRRALVLLGTDLGEVKNRTEKHLKKNKPVYYLVHCLYIIARAPYRGLKYIRHNVLHGRN